MSAFNFRMCVAVHKQTDRYRWMDGWMNKWLDKEIISATRTIAYSADFGTGSGLACSKKHCDIFLFTFLCCFFYCSVLGVEVGGDVVFSRGSF